MNKRLIMIVVSCLIFGFAAGIITTRIATKKRIHQMMEMQKAPRFMKHLKDELELNESQLEWYDELMQKHMDKVRVLRKAERGKMKAEMDSLFNDLRLELDDAQKLKLEKFEHQLRKNGNRKGRGHGERNNRREKKQAL